MLLATKPTISIESMAKAADQVLVLHIESQTVLQKPAQDAAGQWQPFYYEYSGSVEEVLSSGTDVKQGHTIRFRCSSLTFEQGKRFIVFLQNQKAAEPYYRYIDGPARLLSASVPHRLQTIEVLKQLAR